MARYTYNEAVTVPAINTELERIQEAIVDTLSRKGDAPNAMEAPIDMNSNRILNLPFPDNDHEPARKVDLGDYISTVTGLLNQTTAEANRAESEADDAEDFAVQAAASAATAVSNAAMSSRSEGKIANLSHFKELGAVSDPQDGETFNVRGFYINSDIGGGLFHWDATKNKTEHNAVTVIDPDRVSSWNGLSSDLPTLFTAGASGAGCFVRIIDCDNFNALWFGVVQGVSFGDNNTAAYNHINTVVGSYGPAGSGGGVCYFPAGLYEMATSIVMPNRVSWKGAGRATIFRAKSAFPQQQMFHFVNGTSSMFNSRLEDCWIQVNNEPLIERAVLADSWQENCGLKRVVISGFQDRGVVIRLGYGGAAYLRFDDVEIFGSNLVPANYGIDCQQVSLVGAFVLHLNGCTVTGGDASTKLLGGVRMVFDSLICDGFHTEYAASGIIFDGDGVSSVRCATGSFNDVDNLITINGTFNGQLDVTSAIPNGATTTIRNIKTGRLITGVVSGYRTGFDFSPAVAKGWVCFDGTTGTIRSSFNVSGVSVNGVGDYTVSWDNDFRNTDYMVVSNHNSTTSRLALTKELGKTTGQYRVGTFEWTGASAGSAVAVDPTNVYVAAYASI